MKKGNIYWIESDEKIKYPWSLKECSIDDLFINARGNTSHYLLNISNIKKYSLIPDDYSGTPTMIKYKNECKRYLKKMIFNNDLKQILGE